MTTPRRIESLRIRQDAAELAYSREHPQHINNGEEYRYRNGKTGKENKPTHIANFTKGLPHCTETGLLLNPADYQQFVLGIQSGDTKDFALTPLGTAPKLQSNTNTRSIPDAIPKWQSNIAQNAEEQNAEGKGKPAKLRAWESAGAGLVFELEGYDAQAVTMPPAPTLDSPELALEMAEVYLQALLRDVHFSELRDPSLEVVPITDTNCTDSTSDVSQEEEKETAEKCAMQVTVTKAIEILNNINPEGQKLKRQQFDKTNIFRGIAKGDNVGPYISQFLLIGNEGLNQKGKKDKIHQISDGFISYGSIRIDQKVRKAKPCKDYMTTFEAYVDVQNGADLRGLEEYDNTQPYRFITTPRDLATYVHYDALYEAYLNACLILLGMGAPFDPGIPFQNSDVEDKQQGFAHFGGPQILSLVCEVATRALKAVRYQKFNVHRRLRPEAVGGLIDRYKKYEAECNEEKKKLFQPVENLIKELDCQELLEKVKEHNKLQNEDSSIDSYLLPMAFPEGSPMHPSYGAGHATVAGACVTILKAFFDHGWELDLGMECDKYISYEANSDGSELQKVLLDKPLTVEGELNKVAANIAIGRDWAGVHYYSDYLESLRLGERIAIGILEEQKLTYGENFTMTVPLFDGGAIRI